MASDVTMPRLSDSMEEGTVLKWLVDEGGEVKRGEPLVEIETDKANMTYESDSDGTLIEIVAQEGDTLAIGEVIGRIGDPSEAGGDGAKPSGEAKEEAPAKAEEEAAEREEERDEVAAGQAEAGEAEAGEKAGDEEGAEEPRGEQPVAGASAGGGETEAGGGAATKTRAPSGNGDGGRVKASPVARRMAREL